MRKGCDIADEMIDRGMSKSDVNAADIKDRLTGDQIVEQADLVWGHLLGNQVGDNVEVGTVREEIGCSLVVLNRCCMEGQATGVFIETEHHHGRFIIGQFNLFLHEQMTEDGDG